ncbi:MAG: hypothetical protein ABS68_12310 [Niastella sp. SCN 39-18]|nr:MAG: hypothetical protein ABS68_12310 [Niastella sp. SCN 39-18]OJW08325.1 MAG: hypothetical protein BGO53_05300 [Sphingobacteriales bacterium 39-19]
MLSKNTVKYIQSLQQKKLRDSYQCFIAEGPKLVTELLKGGLFTCQEIYALPQWIQLLPAGMVEIYGSRIFEVEDFELEKISGQSTPNQVLAIFKQKQADPSPDFKNKISLVLDEIQDPGNLGTIIRIADWFGIQNIICSLHTTELYNPKVVQSSMASLGRVNVIYCDLAAFLAMQKIKKYATVLAGTPLQKCTSVKEGFIVIGNEAKGIKEDLIALCDEKITISRIGQAESLNAAVATGIILHHLVHA